MNTGLGIAGLICVALAIGHTTVGVVWVFPSLEEECLPQTPFGPPSFTMGMLRVSWYIVTIFCLTIASVLITFAWAGGTNPRTVLLRSVAAGFLAATVMAAYISRRRLRSALRLPVPLLWVLVAALCWEASA